VPEVVRKIVIEAEPRVVYELAKDMESYPSFMPDVESVKVVSRGPSSTVTEWVTDIDGTPFLWTEEDRFDDEALRIDYNLTEGDLERFEGSWTFQKVDAGTEVCLSVNYDFGLPELTNLIGPTLHQKVGENCEMMLSGMKRLVEAARTA
jgi:ribosome-associated toxin RatA of RatAB toxin-antitoxin module